MKHNKNDLKNYQPQDPAKKKVCKFCGNNKYSDKYSSHLRKQHADLINARKQIKSMVKKLNAEQLGEVKIFIDKCSKE